jgi:hypothetical protein
MQLHCTYSERGRVDFSWIGGLIPPLLFAFHR